MTVRETTQAPRVFTIAEVNALLPSLSGLVGQQLWSRALSNKGSVS